MTTTLTKPERFLKIINEGSIEFDGMDNCNSNPEYQDFDECPPSYGTTQRQEQERSRGQSRTIPNGHGRALPRTNDALHDVQLRHEHDSGRISDISVKSNGGGINFIVGSNHTVTIGGGNCIGNNSPPPLQRPVPVPTITDSEETVSVGMGQYVSSNLGCFWKPVGRLLDLNDADLDYIDQDNRTASDSAYDMIRKWRQKKGKGASYKVLAMALVKTDPRLYDLAASVGPDGISV